MNHRVEVTATAEAEAYEIYRYIAEDLSRNAARWYDRLAKAIESLNQFPKRCRRAAESGAFGEEIRQLRFGHYRILFIIRARTVFVLHIRHGARRFMTTDEIEFPEP